VGFQAFYWTLHRAMLQHLLFVHRWHHRSRVTTPLSGQSMSVPRYPERQRAVSSVGCDHPKTTDGRRPGRDEAGDSRAKETPPWPLRQSCSCVRSAA
jgi:hypothetical protein